MKVRLHRSRGHVEGRRDLAHGEPVSVVIAHDAPLDGSQRLDRRLHDAKIVGPDGGPGRVVVGHGLDRRIALMTLELVGTRPRNMMAGFMVATAAMSACAPLNRWQNTASQVSIVITETSLTLLWRPRS